MVGTRTGSGTSKLAGAEGLEKDRFFGVAKGNGKLKEETRSAWKEG